MDSLMVDEAHYFKNAMIATKMRNVAGISQTESQKSSDMLMKCMYLGRGDRRARHRVCDRHTDIQLDDGNVRHDALSAKGLVGAGEGLLNFDCVGIDLWGKHYSD